MSPNRVSLFVPSVRKNNGTGHLKRCLKLVMQINHRQEEKAYLYIDSAEADISHLQKIFPDLTNDIILEKEFTIKLNRIILDRRETSREELLDWESIAPVILLDEGGQARSYGSFLLDAFPGLNRHDPNRKGLSFLDIPVRDRDVDLKTPSILITFGGEDPAGLTTPVINSLIKDGINPSRIGVVQGGLFEEIKTPHSVTIYKNINNLAPLFQEYDCVITSFGLTPFEAFGAGCSVVLVNPTSYHERLSRLTPFLSAGINSKGAKKVPRCLRSLLSIDKNSLINKLDGPTLAETLIKLGNGQKNQCPLCGSKKNPVTARFSQKTYYTCKTCHNYYMVNWQMKEEIYDREYFFSRYKNQYGKTYLEDFSYIKEVSRIRVLEILNCISYSDIGRLKITDLGCAFGPFLSAAQEKGLQCQGVEINPDGAKWIEENLHLPVINGSLEDERVSQQLRKDKSDIVTLWYVIEHLSDQKRLLTLLYQSIRNDGVLAFGTPSGRGISALRDLTLFLKQSPHDHFVIYTPRGVKYILAEYGFTVKKIKSVGHHPERFGKWVGKKDSFSYNALMNISRLFSLGDSLEVYALKERKK